MSIKSKIEAIHAVESLINKSDTRCEELDFSDTVGLVADIMDLGGRDALKVSAHTFTTEAKGEVEAMFDHLTAIEQTAGHMSPIEGYTIMVKVLTVKKALNLLDVAIDHMVRVNTLDPDLK